jgi:circadian clock protein KaiB
MDQIRLTLYVAGPTPRSLAAERSLRALCDRVLAGRAELSVVDVTADPEAAERERILTTPTVVRTHPAPHRRATGDLGDGTRVLAALGLDGHPHPDPAP